MIIHDFRIRNYKSYRDSGDVQLTPGFNVFIGKNNGGKTALLECLSVMTLQNKPHRYSGIPRGQSLPPDSLVDFTVVFEPNELREALLAPGLDLWFPLQDSDRRSNEHLLGRLAAFIEETRQIKFTVNHGPGFSAPYPSHGLFTGRQTNLTVQFGPNDAHDGFRVLGAPTGNNDSVATKIGAFFAQSTYSFRAERYSLGARQFGDRATLASNAENLAEVLNVLQGQYERFEKFNSLVRAIFPTIRRVSVRPKSNMFEIMIWNSEAPADREDLAIELSESGTGVGQVLAMLYIIVTSNSPRTIVIDEPNTFLHPGALRTLVEIMKSTEVKHQYVVTTHSPDFIRIADAENVHLVQWQGEQSSVERIDARDIISFRRTLLDIGARLSDLFGADHVLWVEGPTEEECFPRIIHAASLKVRSGFAVIALRATGDFESRSAKAVAIWEIYARLSTGGKLMPTTTAISLDREDRSDVDMADAKKISNDLIHFLPRRCFENFLLHPRAITVLLNSLPTFHERPIEEQVVRNWLNNNGGSDSYSAKRAWTGDPQNSDWLKIVNGATLLWDLVEDLTETREIYRKVEHGAALTQWICENEPTHFAELVDYLQTVC